ncbi:MAG: 1-(5-phosphoribosyl)-5-[(5-phosphoribosylamino)methylideneamino]imidazole-4-carboxamide isomerase [Candidatus Sumerlaeia bacterium]|nr:1-(5-phosphoribosyl)-5-[(5-phosphoribosylamino)methylideneamino]imidazole-4-carboxamide isomerase [Candidatus Sumerlaeia bacterium]
MYPFLVIPAIDLMSGRCVRLQQGRADARTEFGGNPAEIAQMFEAAGARRIHVVDLDGAFTGAPENLEAIRAIRRAVGCEIELGGGLRTREAVSNALSEGINYVILGTLAVEQPEMLKDLVAEFDGQILVAIDARNGMVAVRGWVTTESGLDAESFARQMAAAGVRTFLHTDISRDGMLQGPNIEATRALAQAVPASFIASGGVSCFEDLQALVALNQTNIIGAVVGRALYDGRIDLARAIAMLK